MVFSNRMLRKIFGPKRKRVVGGWIRLHKEYLQNLNASPNFVRAIKSWRIYWARHVARMGGGGGEREKCI
jgi:hypothetical protein